MKLDVTNLSHAMVNQFLFRNLNFTIQQGDWWSLQGTNGSGKSTLLKIIAGLVSPTKGKILWQEQNIIQNRTAYCTQLSYLGHKDGLKKALTPVENLLATIPEPQRDQQTRMMQILGKFRLHTYQDTPCDTLSAGQQRKVALASIILQQKMLWLLDEPLNSLDAHATDVFNHYALQHVSNRGMIIMASHGVATDSLAHTINLSTKTLC